MGFIFVGGLLGIGLAVFRNTLNKEKVKIFDKTFMFFVLATSLFIANLLRKELPKEGSWRVFHTADELADYKEVQEMKGLVDNISKQLNSGHYNSIDIEQLKSVNKNEERR